MYLARARARSRAPVLRLCAAAAAADLLAFARVACTHAACERHATFKFFCACVCLSDDVCVCYLVVVVVVVVAETMRLHFSSFWHCEAASTSAHIGSMFVSLLLLLPVLRLQAG